MEDTSYGKIAGAIFAAFVGLFLLVAGWNSAIRVDAGEVVVVQGAAGGMSVYTDPGWETCFFGKVTHYQKSFQYAFDHDAQAIPIRFNDGAQGTVNGSVRVDLPLDRDSILAINATFGSQEAVDQQLIRSVVEKSIYMTGPLMSSKESYAEKRTSLIGEIEDQAAHGVYQTKTVDVVVQDPITNEQKHGNMVEIVKDTAGAPLRQEDSPLTRFKIHLYNLTLNGITYSDAVEKQIAAQQQATMQVQTAMANAKKAEQDALTAAKEGEAAATKTKWDQEAINAKIVAEAEGLALAAEQNKKAAAFNKDAAILDGQGQAEKKRLLTAANNNLDQKVQAMIQINANYASAIQNCRGNLVPAVVMGNGGAGAAPSNVADLIDLLKVKTARELSLDMSLTNNLSNQPVAMTSDTQK